MKWRYYKSRFDLFEVLPGFHFKHQTKPWYICGVGKYHGVKAGAEHTGGGGDEPFGDPGR
jgi:hypothetical protein